METKIKKVIALLLTVVLLFSAIPLGTMTATASGGVKAKLDSFIANYPSGKRWTGSFDNGSQCYGFGKLVIYNIFGKNNSGGYRSWSYAGVSTSGMDVIGSTTSFSASKVQNLLSKAKCGDILQFNEKNQHTMVVYSVDSTGVTVYDCNWDNSCGISKRHSSFGTWAGRDSSKLTLLRSNNYASVDGSTPQTLTVDSRYPTPFKCRIISESKVQCYNNTEKTSSPGYIYPDDDCVITEIYTNGLLKCECPWSDGTTKTVYIDKSAFINSSMAPTSMSAPQYSTTFLRSDGRTSIGWIDPGDSLTKVAESGGYTQIIYPASQGKRCGWVPTSALAQPDKVDYPTPFYCRIISTSKVKCYNDVGYTSSPGNIYPEDDCTITALYSNGKVQCLCPWSDGTTKTVYIDSSAFFVSTPTPTKMVAPKHALTYLRTSSTSSSWGWIDAGDVIYRLGTSGSMTQILYPTNSGKYRCGWVYTSDITQTYTVSYNANGGNGAPSSQTKKYDVKLTLSSSKPTRNGYSFVGWSTAANATSAQYAAGGAYTANANATLYAVWKANQYNISYDANGGNGAPNPQTKTHDIALVLSSTKPSRDGYRFLGWSTSPSASGATYNSGSSYTKNSAVTLYAVWQANVYTISYDANGGSNAPASQTKTHDIPLSLSSAIPTREGYLFIGWGTQRSSDDLYSQGETVFFNSDIVLYAQWSEITATTIVIATKPTKTTYEIGEALNTSGLTLELTYSDGSVKTVSSGFSVRGFDSATAGTKTVTVSYGSLEASFTVEIKTKTIDKNAPKIIIGTKTAKPGDTVEVSFEIKNAPKLKSFSITDLNYDATKLKFEKAVCNVDSAAISQVLPNGNAVVALNNNSDINGLIFTYTFTVKSDIADCSIPISCSFSAKEKPEGGTEQSIAFSVVQGEIVIKNCTVGDLNGDDVVDSDDSIYLLWYTYLPEDYPLNQNADFNGDGIVDSDDSIYLLWYTYLPEDYPLK